MPTTKTKQNEYLPNQISHPGITLKEKLNEMPMGPKEFAIRTGKPEKTISQILSLESGITPDMAIVFEDVLGIPAHFWINRQKLHDEAKARAKREATIESATDWAAQFPYAAIAKLGWVVSTRNPTEKTENLFQYFGIATQQGFEDYYFNQKLKVNFRISLAHTKMPFAFAAWLRQGELQAKKLDAPAYDARKFELMLHDIKKVMAAHPTNFFDQLQKLGLEAGVKIVYTPCIPGATVHGSTRWIGDTPIIQLSARYKQNDIFWFTFFHEAGHIMLHGKKYISIENVEYQDQEIEKEKEADEFAIKWTFSQEQEEEVKSRMNLTVGDIEMFAKKFGTHPAMIIGRFHHKKLLPYSVGRQFIETIDLT